MQIVGESLPKYSTAKVYSGEIVGQLPMVKRTYDGESDVRGIPMCE